MLLSYMRTADTNNYLLYVQQISKYTKYPYTSVFFRKFNITVQHKELESHENRIFLSFNANDDSV